MYEDTENIWALKQALRPQYTALLQMYYHLASFNRIGNNFYVNPADLRILIIELGLCDKRLPESALTLVISSVQSKIHEVELDLDYSAKKVISGYQTITRAKFTEFVYRMAAEKYCKKPKQYLLDKLAKRSPNESPTGKVVVELAGNNSEVVDSQVLHVRKNQVLLPIKEAVSRVCKALEAFVPSLTVQRFR